MPIGFMMSMTMEQRSNLSRAFKLMLHTAGIHSPMPTALARAYDAPFPDPSFKMGPRAMPSQVPTLPTSPSMEEQRKAWRRCLHSRDNDFCAPLLTTTLLLQVSKNSSKNVDPAHVGNRTQR